MIYDFENYSLDTDRRELRCGSESVAVEPQVFDVLQYLIRNRARVVSKDDLIAEVWNGRIVSESTLSSRIAAARQAVGDRGEDQRLIRTIPRRGFRFVGEVAEMKGSSREGASAPAPPTEPAHQSPQTAPALRLPDKPSIAVLPFANMSGDPEQEYFVDGIVEDITTALSQFRQLFVIGRSSSFTYKSRVIDLKQVGRELGVRYVLEGSVRKVAERVRITAQLIDATTAVHLWANHFDGGLEDIFDLQDQVTESVVGAIGPKLEQVEIERAKRKPTESLDAYDYYLRGMGSLYQWTRAGVSEALALFHKAIEIDPGFAAAYGMAAYCYVQRKSYGWFTDWSQELAESGRLARRAAELGKEDAIALSRAAHVITSIVGDVERGAALIDEALALNPNLSVGWYVAGWIKTFLGEPEAAIERLTRAMRLSPFDPLIYRVHAGIAYAHFFAGRHDEASAWAEKAVHANPDYLTGLRGAAVGHAMAGRLDRARKLLTHMRELAPALRISNLPDLMPFRRPADFAKWEQALRMAGLPE